MVIVSFVTAHVCRCSFSLHRFSDSFLRQAAPAGCFSKKNWATANGTKNLSYRFIKGDSMKRPYVPGLKLTVVAIAALLALPLRSHAIGCMSWGGCDNISIFAFLIPFVCAPEVAEGNLQATERVLNELAGSPDFAHATTFQAEVKRIASLKPDERVAAYFTAAGVDASNTEEVVTFIGSRAPQTKNILALEKTMDLTPAQADRVVQRLTEALRGGVR
jgi:hypothetical protein